MSNESKKSKKGTQVSGKKVWKDVEFTSVVFPAQPKKVYRATIQLQEEATLIIEDNKTHEKWTCLIENASKHGPDMSIPQEAFIAAIESGLEQLDSASNVPRTSAGGKKEEAPVPATKREAGAVEVNMSPIADCMNITLQIHVSKIWVPEYTFVLQQVALAKVDLLVAQMRDLQEDKQWRMRSFMTLSNGATHTAAAATIEIQWNGDNNQYDTDMYSLSQEDCAIIVHKPGFYHVHFSLDVQSASSDSYKSRLLINGEKVAEVRQSGTKGTPFSQLQHIVSLEAGDEIKVQDDYRRSRNYEKGMNRFHMYLVN